MAARIGREFFNVDGEPETERERKERLYREREIREAEGDEDPRFERVLKGIDFKILKNIFAERIIKSGGDPSEMNFLGLDSIKHTCLHGTKRGEYRAFSNIIGIDYDKRGVDTDSTDDENKLLILKTLCHEEAHAISKQEHYIIDNHASGGAEIPIKKSYSGYQFRAWQGKSEVLLFYHFGEAVIEKLAIEVMEEYIKRTGYVDKKYLSKFKDKRGMAVKKIKLVDLIIERIAKGVGKNEETVWGTIVRGLLEGEKFADDEFRECLEEIFYPGFLSELSSLSSSRADKMSKKIKKISKERMPLVESRLSHWFKKFYKKFGKHEIL